MSIFGIDAFVIFAIGGGLGFAAGFFGPRIAARIRG